MVENNNKKINVDDLIALSSILDDYDNYSSDIKDLMFSHYSFYVFHQLDDLRRGNNSLLIPKRVKEFYKKNKEIINKIASKTDFILFNYFINNSDNEVYNYNELNYFYNYLINNRDNLDRINKVLNRIKSLGFFGLDFNKNIDFKKDCYSVQKSFGNNTEINYLDNMLCIPNYDNGIVNYRSNGSSYKIILSPSYNNELSYNKNIILNNLNFNYKRLPNKISYDLFSEIVNLKNDVINECNAIRNSVNIHVNIQDLERQLDSTFNHMNELNDVYNKEDMKKQLFHIKEELDILKKYSNDYDKNIVEELDLSNDNLDMEKKLFLRKRKENLD